MPREKQTPTRLLKTRQRPAPLGAAAHNDEAELSPAQQLGSLGGAARARNLTAEQRREIAQNAAAKRWALARNLPPSGRGEVMDGPASVDELIARNRQLLAQATEERLRARHVRAQAQGQRSLWRRHQRALDTGQ